MPEHKKHIILDAATTATVEGGSLNGLSLSLVFDGTDFSVVESSDTPAGSDYQILTLNSSNALVWNNILYDSRGIESFDYWNRVVLDTSGLYVSVDWGDRMLKDSTGQISTDWQQRHLLFNDGSTISVDWQGEALIDTSGNGSVFWGTRLLYDLGFIESIDWQNRALFDANGISSVDWNNRYLLFPNTNTGISYHANGVVILGDVKKAANHTTLNVNDNTQAVSISNAGLTYVEDLTGNPFLYLNVASKVYAIGDVNSTYNATGVSINDRLGTVLIGDIYGNNSNLLVNKISETIEFVSYTYKSLLINNDPSVATVVLGDVGSYGNETTFAINDVAKTITLSNSIVTAPQYSVPLTGGTVTSNGSTQLILNPAGTLASLDIVLPASPVDGQQFWVCTTNPIGTLIYFGADIVGNPAGISASTPQHYVYSALASTWIRN